MPSGLSSLLNDGVNGQSKEDRANRVALLHSPGAGNNLITSSAGAREKMTVVAILVVHPWCGWTEGQQSDAQC